MGNLLEIKNVSKHYSNHVALKNVSLAVPEGSVFGLLGPNGAGKTSLIRIINQITGPDSGEIFLKGEKLQPAHVEKIGYLPEERGLYKKMSVHDQVLYLARLKGLSRDEALKRMRFWFSRFEMEGWRKKKIEELSKGMQQKVQFIVTVIHEPELLILDEPFSGFDPINADLIKNEILELKEKGSTIIFSTHRMESVEELCDHIALINKSEKVLDGPKSEIKARFKTNTYNIKYSGELLTTSADFDIINTEQIEDNYSSSTIKLNTGTPVNQLIRQIIDQVELRSFGENIPTMNDIFKMVVNESID